MMDEKVRDLFWAAMDIVGEFDAYGEVLQTGDNDEYGPDSSIEKLRTAMNALDPELKR